MSWNLRPEEKLQIAAMKFLRLALPSGAVVRSIDHGVAMNDSRRQILHARGVRAGLPDIMLWWAGKHAQIELKSDGGVQSAAQKEHQEYMRANGIPYAVCYSLHEIDMVLRGWGWPLRASVMPTTAEGAPKGKAPRKRTSKSRAPRASASKLAAFQRLQAEKLL